jgi:hypothetical protein
MNTLRILVLAATLTTTAMAADPKVTLVRDDSPASILRKSTGQRVELVLKSGQRLAGKIEAQGDQTVHLTALAGQELFEAVIVIDDVSAVILRTANK